MHGLLNTIGELPCPLMRDRTEPGGGQQRGNQEGYEWWKETAGVGEEEASWTATRVGEEMRARLWPAPKKMGAGRWLDPEETGC